ncbi:MAG TPA: TadE family protein [Terracidiphilus sp.]
MSAYNLKPEFLKRVLREQRIRNESGSALVEMALSAGLILAIFLCVIQFGFALYAYQYVTEVSRELTRYSIVRGSACTGGMPNCNFYDTGATLQSYVQNTYIYPGIDMSKVTVTTAWFQPVKNADETISSFTSCSGSGCNKPGYAMKATVSYPFLLAVPFLPNRTLNVSSSSVMVISQ